MSYPHTYIFPGAFQTVVISGPHLQVLAASGDVVHSTAKDDFDSRESVLKSGPVRCATVDASHKHLVTVGEDKRMKVWTIDGLKLLSERELPKKPTQVLFARDEQTILVADKFGDVFSYPLQPPPSDPAKDEKKEQASEFTSHENQSGGTLVLGHVSLLTTALLSPDGRYIITADRDEHIRISWYPQGYCIESYCLGHKRFVSAIHIPSFAPSVLLSGGGDPVIRKWDWMTGAPAGEIPILDAVLPYIAVRVAKRKRWDDGDEEGEGGEGKKAKKQHGRKGRARNKAGVNATVPPDAVAEGEAKDVEMADEMEDPHVTIPAGGADTPEATPAPVDVTVAAPAAPEEPVLVLRRIQTVEVDGTQLIVFNAVGATAVFWCPADATSGELVHAHDMSKPVLDIVSVGDGLFWILLDAQWRDSSAPSGDTTATASPSVKLVRLSPTLLVEVNDSPLLNALNTTSIVNVAEGETPSLDLYADIVSMPKNTEVAHDPMTAEGKKNAKEEGKRRTRQLLAAAQGGTPTPASDSVEERETKRAKSEGESV
ncbi:WD40 repeat-like protein [Peniophora sp. CONT]|nr:WD40 repeat-like protein [Peniophora sp. CONT]